MSKCPNILSIYYLQKELKDFGLEILVSYGVLGYFELKQVFMLIFCAKLFQIFSNKYFETFCSKESDKKKFELYQVFIHYCMYQNG